jgi:formyl-CoA transferase
MEHDPLYNGADGKLSAQSWAYIDRLVEDVFGEITVAAAVEALHREGVPAAPVNEPQQVIDDAQVVHNQSLHTWDHPAAGVVRQPRQPVRFQSSPTPVLEFVDALGERTDEVLLELGRSPAAIDELRAAGIVA